MHLRLFLVRHGETVDNVAAIIAGVRDSPLTNHGFQQAKRLGNYLNASGIDLTHVFASPLQRAHITAQQILLAQSESIRKVVSVTTSPSLQEQDFGPYEGVAYGEYRISDTKHAGVETTQMMARRADCFIEQYLEPLIEDQTPLTVVIVSHGRMLQVLWAQILLFLKPDQVKCDRQLLVDTSSLDYTHIGSWSNTGFIEVLFKRTIEFDLSREQPEDESKKIVSPDTDNKESAIMDTANSGVAARAFCEAVISAINGRAHLTGLVRTKGGVGSARYDAQQKTIDKFFVSKRPKS